MDNNTQKNENPNNNEPIILGTLKKEKSSKPIIVLIIFFLILATVFMLPNIKNYMATNNNAITRFYNTYLKSFVEKEDNYNETYIPSTTTTTTTKTEELKNIIITCTLNNDKYTYNFKGDKLESIKHIFSFNYNNNIDNYMTKYQEYQNIVNYYNNNTNYISKVYEDSNGFIFENDIDLTKAIPSKISQYKNDNYYDLNTNKESIIKLQKDKGFSCV